MYIFDWKKTTYDLISLLLLGININLKEYNVLLYEKAFMLIDCICGESKFAINAEQIGFDGRLVKCGKCGKEWFQESKLDFIKMKLW